MTTMATPGRRWTSAFLGLALAATPLSPALSQPSEPPDGPPARDVGLVERAGRRLAQLDVTVSGPEEAIRELGRGDFELVVMGRFMEEFVVDNLCAPSGAEPFPADRSTTARAEPTSPPPAPPARAAPVSYLFYFDQHHLVLGGRQEAIEKARALIPELIDEGNRAMIVSSGEELVVFADLTDDAGVLLAALERLEHDRRQWDPHPMEEDLRVREVLKVLQQDGDTQRAKQLARSYQREERWRTERALHLFSISLGRLADVDPPKAVVYFADTMRANAGAHYTSFFSQRADATQRDPVLSAMELDSFSAATAFDRVVEEAGAHGIRLYTVQAEGMVGQSMVSSARGQTARGANLSGQTMATTRRTVDAQNSLVTLAAETGGEAFLHGVRAARIAERIRSDLSCVYLISFDPTGFPLDRGLPVLVRVGRPKVKVHARGQLVLQSESERLSSRLLSAFASPQRSDRLGGLRGLVVPTGYADGKFTALVQMAAPASPLSGTRWELGLSLVSRGKVREHAAGSAAVSGPGVPVVFEAQVSFSPGPFEIVMVARESTGQQVHSTRIEGDWPDPDEAAVTLVPIVALQPGEGLFLRDGEVRPRGPLAREARELLRVDLPTAMIGLVCRSGSRRSTLNVERTLAGADRVDFPTMELELGEERCAQIRDVIPADVMSPGAFNYAVRIVEENQQVAGASLEFMAAASGAGHEQGAAVEEVDDR